nr:MAG TPA: hypothetical protein [Caudoviricetes sp.]
MAVKAKNCHRLNPLSLLGLRNMSDSSDSSFIFYI